MLTRYAIFISFAVTSFLLDIFLNTQKPTIEKTNTQTLITISRKNQLTNFLLLKILIIFFIFLLV